MKYKIFFDESKKIDNKSEYSYYGAISVEEKELANIESQIEQILTELDKLSELHFVNYKPSEIKKYFQVLDYFLSSTAMKFNIYRLNNNHYFQLGKKLKFNESELRKYFYVKIPERLFYGLVRDDDNIDSLEIVMDNSTEYQTLGIFEQISDQMNAHSLYRGKSYHVHSVSGIDSKHSRMIQILDIILGIAVYLLEYDKSDSSSSRYLSRQDLIYRLLTNRNNLNNFHQMISIFTWDQDSSNFINKLETSSVTSQFLLACTKNDYLSMLPVQHLYIKHQNYLKSLDATDRNARIKLLKNELENPYSTDKKLNNSLVELFLGHLCQIEFKDRNKYLKRD